MGGRKKLTNNTGIPQHRIEAIARCILPDVLAFYESEEGQREFAEWKKQRELEKQEVKAGQGRKKGRAHRENGCVRLFCAYGVMASSEGPSAWRQACALPRCESRYFHTDRKKPIIRTHLLPETSSDYIGLVSPAGFEPTTF